MIDVSILHRAPSKPRQKRIEPAAPKSFFAHHEIKPGAGDVVGDRLERMAVAHGDEEVRRVGTDVGDRVDLGASGLASACGRTLRRRTGRAAGGARI